MYYVDLLCRRRLHSPTHHPILLLPIVAFRFPCGLNEPQGAIFVPCHDWWLNSDNPLIWAEWAEKSYMYCFFCLYFSYIQGR